MDLRPTNGADPTDRTKENAWLVNGICRQCHASDGPFYPDGTAWGNSLESLEQDNSACASEISCTDCHDPHQAGPPEGSGPDNPAHIAACHDCHAGYDSKEKLQAHSKHLPQTASCLDCHMPRTNVGILHAVRTHRIAVPGDPRMMAVAGPNACNLCHLDKSIAWTMEQLETMWGRHTEPEPGWAKAWGGSLDTPAVDVWMKADAQTTQMFLTDALTRRNGPDSLPRLVELLEDPCGATRAFALMGIERLHGRLVPPEEFDAAAVPAVRAQQLEKARADFLARP
jgi:hypothetical protein